MTPKCAFYDRKWTDGSIPLDSVSQNLERLGKVMKFKFDYALRSYTFRSKPLLVF
ncbi:hypothetical protein KFK09_014907 [Dendrobium nobile]|uniref:Uncharacterized protein n=1 Tax=Dendrobium nobile TaxID=94219 RepID=A0A8T3B3C5_DENNO|nr:hypothetical protein KFK09_014907 [Dendrobium nobile]